VLFHLGKAGLSVSGGFSVIFICMVLISVGIQCIHKAILVCNAEKDIET
jgi:hypothetical protein